MKILPWILLCLFSLGALYSTINITPVAGQGTIFIRADGSIDPPSAPLASSDNITYSVTGDIGTPIVVERDNIVIEGMEYSITGWPDAVAGIDLSNRKGVIVRNAQIALFIYGIQIWNSSNCSALNCKITKSGTGFYLFNSSTNEISGNEISDTGIADIGVLISYQCSNNSIFENNITCGGPCIWIDYECSYNDVYDNTIATIYGPGITVSGVSYLNTVKDNYVRSMGPGSKGVFLQEANSNTICRNNLTQNFNGIELDGSSFNNISMNDISHGGAGIKVDGPIPGLPQVSECNLFAENNVCYNQVGIDLRSPFNVVLRNNVTNNDYGISSQFPAALRLPTHLTIEGNFISNNSYGINLFFVRDAILSGNTFTNNDIGILAGFSFNNSLFHNNFEGNSKEIEIRDSPSGPVSENEWDAGYPIGGNYWSDYRGVDVYRGKYQNETGSDGIGDTPYIINSTNRDNYPLVNPYNYAWDSIVGDVNKDGKVNMRDIGLLCSAFGTTSSDPRWNPDCDLNGDGIVNAVDLGISCNSYGKKT